MLATCDFADTANSDVVIIPAGARQNEGESRLDLVARNVAIESIVPQIALHSPDCVILVLSNPVDIMTHVAREISGFTPSRVVGSGTALDTSRFRSLLAQHLDVDSGSVHGLVLGEHGDSSVVVWSQLFVGGVRLRDVHPAIGTDAAEEVLRTMHSRVIGAAGDIIVRKGYTNWALGLAVNSIVPVHPPRRTPHLAAVRARAGEARHRGGCTPVAARAVGLGRRAGRRAAAAQRRRGGGAAKIGKGGSQTRGRRSCSREGERGKGDEDDRRDERRGTLSLTRARCVVEETTEMNRDAKRDARGSRRGARVNKKTAGRERMF